MKEKKNRQKFEHNPPRPSCREVCREVGNLSKERIASYQMPVKTGCELECARFLNPSFLSSVY